MYNSHTLPNDRERKDIQPMIAKEEETLDLTEYKNLIPQAIIMI